MKLDREKCSKAKKKLAANEEPTNLEKKKLCSFLLTNLRVKHQPLTDKTQDPSIEV